MHKFFENFVYRGFSGSLITNMQLEFKNFQNVFKFPEKTYIRDS